MGERNGKCKLNIYEIFNSDYFFVLFMKWLKWTSIIGQNKSFTYINAIVTKNSYC